MSSSNPHLPNASATLRGRLSRYMFIAVSTLIAGVRVIRTAWVTIF